MVHLEGDFRLSAAIPLDKHFFYAGGFELLEPLELDGVFGNQLVERAEVGTDFLLFLNGRQMKSIFRIFPCIDSWLTGSLGVDRYELIILIGQRCIKNEVGAPCTQCFRAD